MVKIWPQPAETVSILTLSLSLSPPLWGWVKLEVLKVLLLFLNLDWQEKIFVKLVSWANATLINIWFEYACLVLILFLPEMVCYLQQLDDAYAFGRQPKAVDPSLQILNLIMFGEGKACDSVFWNGCLKASPSHLF